MVSPVYPDNQLWIFNFNLIIYEVTQENPMSVHVRLNIVNLKDPDNFQIHT